ncbi:MAG: potassium transporter [Myxococcales bacterium]
MSFRQVFRLLGVLIGVQGALMLVPAVWSAWAGERDSAWALGAAAAITMTVGGVGVYAGRRTRGRDLHRREALLTVALGWIGASAAGALPYLLDGAFTSFVDAFFETASGLTTTGSTVMTSIEDKGRGVLLWRSLTQWTGGMGIVVLFIAIFPELGVGGKHLFRSEVPGPITEGLRPKIRETSSALWRIYLTLTAACAGLLLLAGLDGYDAVNHALTTMATGGFSTRDASIAAYDSPLVDGVTTVFMVFAGINFSLYYATIRGGGRQALGDRELRAYLVLLLVATLLVTLDILPRHQELDRAFRFAVFQVASVMTTTGFATDDFDVYPSFSRLLLVALMFVGGCAGSTAGGMKVYRFIVLAKASVAEIQKVFRPQAVLPVRVGGFVVPEDTVRAVLGFFVLNLAIFLAASLYMAWLGLDVVSATTSVAATLYNIGPGLAQVGAIQNFALVPDSGKVLLSACMILGRLELMTLLVLMLPAFWRR